MLTISISEILFLLVYDCAKLHYQAGTDILNLNILEV